MKKLLSLFVLWGMVAVGCTEGGIDDSINNEQPGDDKIPENIFFAVDKESATIAPDGGSVDVVVYSNYKWEISGTSDWCTPSMKNGDANEDGQKVTFAADVAYDDREAIFWFRCADEKIKFVVSQRFKEVIIPDANNTFDVPAKGGVAVISYQTTVDCEVIIPEEAKGWISVANTRALVSENINLAVAENTAYSARTAVVKVVAKGNADLVAEYTINQAQKDAILVGENKTFTVPYKGGDIVIDYQTNVECEVVIPVEAQDWITIAPATKGLVTYSTTLNIAENNTGEQRQAIIKVVSVDNRELFAEYNIIQNPRCYIEYTSTDGNIVKPYNASAFGASILSNTYENGVGIIEFDSIITAIGDKAFYDCSNLTSITIPDSVTSIGEDAFFDCSNLTSITIPDSVTSIGEDAFFDCTGELFVNCNIPSASSYYYGAFYGSDFSSVIIGSGVTSIGSYAFYDCSNLTSITIPDSVTSIGEDAFYGCSSLTSVYISDIAAWYNISFEDASSNPLYYAHNLYLNNELLTDLTIPDSVTKIKDYAFCECSNLTSVTIPDSVTSIGRSAFSNCSSLTSVYISDITAWCNISFEGVSNPFNAYNLYLNNELLTDLIIPDSVTKIGGYAFQSCSSLTSVSIPNSVTSIGEDAFQSCRSLTSVSIPNSVTSIGGGAFLCCSSLTSITIPNSVTTIESYMFFRCWSLTSVTIPDSVTSIGSEAFRECSSLTSITIPVSVTSIKPFAFYCSGLTSVTIPDNVTKIGNYAFYCNSLKSIYCKAMTPPTGDSKMFYTGRNIYVPKESVDAYKKAEYWSDYASDIVGYDF